MSIRKKINHKLQVTKTVNALNKVGVPALLITEVDGDIITSLIGNRGRALAAAHIAISQTDWLLAIAQNVTGPKINVSKEVSGGIDTITTDDIPPEEEIEPTPLESLIEQTKQEEE